VCLDGSVRPDEAWGDQRRKHPRRHGLDGKIKAESAGTLTPDGRADGAFHVTPGCGMRRVAGVPIDADVIAELAPRKARPPSPPRYFLAMTISAELGEAKPGRAAPFLRHTGAQFYRTRTLTSAQSEATGPARPGLALAARIAEGYVDCFEPGI